jgi:hypothetical protein
MTLSKLLAAAVFALYAPLVFASSSIYDFGTIDWNRDAGKADGIPMICDDASFAGVSVTVPGTFSRDFDVSVSGVGCALRSTQFEPALGASKLLIENSDNCTVTIRKLDGGATYELDLTDAC